MLATLGDHLTVRAEVARGPISNRLVAETTHGCGLGVKRIPRLAQGDHHAFPVSWRNLGAIFWIFSVILQDRCHLR